MKLFLSLVLVFACQLGFAKNINTIVVNVTTAGTQVPLSATDLIVRAAVIQVKRGNTGYIYVGGSNVSSTLGHELVIPAAGSPLAQFTLSDPTSSMFVDKGRFNLKEVWIDSSVNGEGVTVTYIY